MLFLHQRAEQVDIVRDRLQGAAPEVLISPVDARNAVAVGVLGHASMRNGNIPQDIPPVDPVLEEYFSKMVK